MKLKKLTMWTFNAWNIFAVLSFWIKGMAVEKLKLLTIYGSCFFLAIKTFSNNSLFIIQILQVSCHCHLPATPQTEFHQRYFKLKNSHLPNISEVVWYFEDKLKR